MFFEVPNIKKHRTPFSFIGLAGDGPESANYNDFW